MIASMLRRTAVFVAAIGAAALPAGAQVLSPLPLGQGEEVHGPLDALLMFGLPALGMMLVLGIIAIALFHDRKKDRERFAMLERLVVSGQPVPRELITGEKPPLPLPAERRHDIRRGITLLSFAIAVALILIIGSGGNWRYGVWGLLFLLPSLGSFFKAWLTGREIARGASSGSPQP